MSSGKFRPFWFVPETHLKISNLKMESMVHYSDVIMSVMASQITSLTIVYSTVYSGADEGKHQSSASLAFVRGIHRWPLDSLHKRPVTPSWPDLFSIWEKTSVHNRLDSTSKGQQKHLQMEQKWVSKMELGLFEANTIASQHKSISVMKINTNSPVRINTNSFVMQITGPIHGCPIQTIF